MNRIILIGNGFDLAHGLPTQYKDFIEHYWAKKVNEIKKEGKYIRFRNDYTGTRNDPVYKDKDIVISYSTPLNASSIPKVIKDFFKNEDITVSLVYKNTFLRRIMISYEKKTWVDIEEEYFSALNDCIMNNRIGIDNLNHEFAAIKDALVEYLKEKVKVEIDFPNRMILDNIYSDFNLDDFTKSGVDTIIEDEFQRILFLENRKEKPTVAEKTLYLLRYIHDFLPDLDSTSFKTEFKSLLFNKVKAECYFYLLPKQLLFLNFNYTNTQKNYSYFDYFSQYSEGLKKELKILENETIHIHGRLIDCKNPIIFGYGDEKGKEYLEIENLNDNRFLENVKSIRYLDTDNYKRLLNFIDADKFQIFIMGHSCGLSDRTLLSRLFEHDNCVSIKVFYHQKEDGTDNYSDIVRNISRNFTNKAEMREKVVNKTYCKPLTI